MSTQLTTNETTKNVTYTKWIMDFELMYVDGLGVGERVSPPSGLKKVGSGRIGNFSEKNDFFGISLIK